MPPHRRSRFLRSAASLVLVSALAASPGTARAADDGALERCVESLDDATVVALTDRIDPRIRGHQRRARWWFWGWMATNFGFLVGSTAFALVEDDPKWRDAYWWGAAGSGFTMLTLLLPPLPSAFAARRLGTRGAPNDRAYLARALRLLDAAATQEHAAKAWWTHLGNGSFALAEGLYLGLRHDDAIGVAISNAVISLAISETQAWTSPRAMTRLRRELEAEGSPCMPRTLAHRGPTFDVAPFLGGLTLAIRF